MANTFYFDACNVDSRMSPYPLSSTPIPIDDGLEFYTSTNEDDGKLIMPHSIMNDNVAINYRTIYNGYPLFTTNSDFTEYSDYERCIKNDAYYAAYLADKKNPTYKNIISYYSSEEMDPYGLAKYRMQDFIYLKYYNQIPNNYMITLRRYTKPCTDHMFGLDMSAQAVNEMNNYPDDYSVLATAVTYMGEKTGNKLSDILKFDYGANWEERDGKTESIQNPDGGLSAQLKGRGRRPVTDEVMNGTAKMGGQNSSTAQLSSMLLFSAASLGKNVAVNKAMSSQHEYEGNTYNARYGESLYGDVNVVNKVKLRSRGLTFSNNFSLTFEYSLKSLKCVNPRIAMMDILSNFLILTGNYGTFWGGATIFYGNRNIAPQYGDPNLLRQGKYGEYLKSLAGDVKEGFNNIVGNNENTGFLNKLWTGTKNILHGGLEALVGNLFGGNIGIAGETQAVPALLSGAPSGYWHVTIGNPLDPIAMMGNMAVTKTSVQFSDVLGYDDFPTEVKFTVELEHCMPRDNASIESMFNAGKGRFYSFTNGDILNAYKTIDSLQNFQTNDNMTNQEKNTSFTKDGIPSNTPSKHNGDKVTLNIIKSIGGMMNG